MYGRSVSLPTAGKITHFYHHGYQSWSLSTWVEVDQDLPMPYPTILAPLQYHPSSILEHGKVGHWLGAVKTAEGQVHLMGSANTDCVLRWDGDSLVGDYYGTWEPAPEWYVAIGEESAVFTGYAHYLKIQMGDTINIPNHTIRTWCSWYSFYTSIDQAGLSRTIHELSDLPFDVIQIDDGWQLDIGDWTENEKFHGGLKYLVDQIHATGRQAGIWLAPLIASSSSELFIQHPDWFIKDDKDGYVSAGFNWGKPLFGLDLTHPQAVEWLARTLKGLENLGFTYIKLDFLYGGALPGKRTAPITGEEAYRDGLARALSQLNPKTFLLFCGAPILPSIGLCHALRIGPDVANFWESPRDAFFLHNPATPGARNAIRTCFHRLWLGDVLRIDPDVVYFAGQEHNLEKFQVELLLSLANHCGFKATSDLPHTLSQYEIGQLKLFMLDRTTHGDTPFAEIIQRDRTLLAMPPTPTRITNMIREFLGWLANQPIALRILYWIDQHKLKRKFSR